MTTEDILKTTTDDLGSILTTKLVGACSAFANLSQVNVYFIPNDTFEVLPEFA